MENPSYPVSDKHSLITVRTNAFIAGKTVHDDVFGGPTKFGLRTFSPRVEDYDDIFGGFHALRGSSTIPVLDLPADVDETEGCFDVRRSEVDYSEVFGGFDFAFECGDLFNQAKCGNEPSEEAWDYEANRRSQDGMPNETHVSQSPIIPGFTFDNDEIAPSRKKEDKFVPPSQVTDDINITSGFFEMDIGGNHLRKTMPCPPNTIIIVGKDIIKPVKKYMQTGSFDNEMFITVSEISLKTDPSELPPPLRPPPIRNVYSGELAIGDSLPSFFDVEVDASSSATASAAAMKQVMELAQAKLRSAKELTERKEGLQNRSKLASKTNIKDSKVKITKMVDELNNLKDKSVHGLNEPNSRREVPYLVDGEEFFDVVEKSTEKRHGNKFCSSQEFVKTEAPGEWKEANDFFELVEIDNARKPIDDANNGIVHLQYTESNGQPHKEKKIAMEACERDDNKKILKVLKDTQRQEDKMKVKVAAESNNQKEDEKKFKISYELRQIEKNKPMVDLWNDDLVKGQPKENYMEFEQTVSQENNHNQQLSNDRTVNGKRLTKTAERVEYKNQLEEAFEMVETVEISKQNLENDELERRLEELQVQEELEKKQKEIHQREENERRLKVDFESKENEKKQKEARERELNENKIKEDLEQKENGRRLKEDFELKENEKKQKDARERELDQNKTKEDLERKENDKRLKEALEKIANERKHKEAHNQEECEKREKEFFIRKEVEKREKEALIRKEVDKRLSEAREREEYEKGLQEAQKLPEREDITEEEVNNQEGTGQISRPCCTWAKNKNSGNEGAEGIEQKGLPEAQEDTPWNGNEKKLNLAQETRVPMKTGTLNACAEVCKVDDKAAFDHEGNTANVEATKEIFTNEAGEKIRAVPRDGESVVETIEKESVPFDKRFEASDIVQGGLQAEETKPSREDELRTTPRDQSANVKGDSVIPSGQTGVKGRKENLQTSSDKENAKEKFTREGGQNGKNVGQDEVVLDLELNKGEFRSTQMSGEGVKNNKKIGTAPSNTSEGKTHTKGIAQVVNTRKIRETNGKNVSEHHRQEKEKEWLKVEEELEQDRLRMLEEEKEREREREKDRVAVERATCEVHERAYAESHERAERAAMEKVTAIARQRALTDARERLEKACAEVREKSLAAKSSMDTRIREEQAAVDRATAEARGLASEKAMAERAAFEARERAERSSSSGSIYVSSTHTGVEVDSAQRCKARVERHRRTAERAAKALAEKNTRDLLAQREQTERNRLAESLDADVKRWSSGKEGNLRALLSTLQYILGPGSGWQPIPLTDIITAVGVKKAYRKATLCVHPDKLQQRRASIQQKYICEKVFDLLKEAWNKLNSEER